MSFKNNISYLSVYYNTILTMCISFVIHINLQGISYVKIAKCKIMPKQ